MMKNANTHLQQERGEQRERWGKVEKGRKREEDNILFLGTLVKGERISSDISLSPLVQSLILNYSLA